MENLENTQKSLSESDLEEFEKRLGRPLPISFKKHYLADNGGNPAQADVENGEWGLPVHGFNPLKYGRLTIELLIKDLDTIEPPDSPFGSWPKLSFIPFAYDAGAHPIFVSLREQDYDSVYIYDPDGGAIKKISSSFEEFRSRLYKNA